MMHHIAGKKFGARYDAANGIVRLEHPQRLRGALAAIAPGRVTDPHVAFFLAQNPGQAEGDEMVCLTELTPANLTRAGRRMAGDVQW